MFDIGFWELAVIAVVALLVVGPKELPNLLRTTGAMVRRARRFIREAKSDLDQEIRKIDDLKQLMAKEAEIAELHKDIDSTKPTIPVNHSSRKAQESTTAQEVAEPAKSAADQSSEASVQPPYGTPK